MMKEKAVRLVKKALRFIANPRLLLCLFVAWMITNGWSYVMMGFGMFFKIEWMMMVAGAYLTFLWLPVSPEKIVTIGLAILFLKLFFPDDQKTLAVLVDMKNRLKAAVKRKAEERKAKKEEKDRAEK